MLELIFCSLVTVLPDYLFRRYRQGNGGALKLTSLPCGMSSVGALRHAWS